MLEAIAGHYRGGPRSVESYRAALADAFRGLDSYCALSAGRGVLAYGGDECYERRGHVVCPWWMLT